MLSTIVPGLDACVTVTPSEGVVIAGPDATERWPSLSAWRDDVGRHGIHGAQRIISASLWTLDAHVRRNGPNVALRPGVAVSWHTAIPTSVGLAGSSALAVGTTDAVAACWGITLDRRICAALALSAERDVLGIAAGWQDRIVQAFGRTVLVDAARMVEVEDVWVPTVHVVADDHPSIRLVIGWKVESASSSDNYHAPLRRVTRSLATPMAELAAVARSATESLERGDARAFSAAVDAGWHIRQACVPLHPDHAAIVELVRASGVSATTPGSGGSVVALCADDDAVVRVRSVLASAGCGCADFAMR